MASNPAVGADPNLVKPGDIVWLDSKHLTAARGTGARTWPHYAICLYYYDPKTNRVPAAILTGTIFQFACISSITRNNPLDPSKQVQLDHTSPNHGLRNPSAACVDFSPMVEVTTAAGRHILDGVKRLVDPVVWRVPASPTLQAVNALFARYWTAVAEAQQSKS